MTPLVAYLIGGVVVVAILFVIWWNTEHQRTKRALKRVPVVRIGPRS